MARHHRVNRLAKIIANEVEIGVANSAIKNIDQNIVRTGLAALEIEWRKERSGILRRIAFNEDHDASNFN